MNGLDPAPVAAAIAARRRALGDPRPLVAAIDGHSGAGKSTLAHRLAALLPAAVIDGDDFFAGGVLLRSDSPAERAAACVDWQAQRSVLATLRAGRRATWHAFDWEAFDGRREAEASACEPVPVILLEGAYSGRPELADLLDLRILLRAPDAVRLARLHRREGGLGPWDLQWHEAEEHYFGSVVSPAGFDLVLETG
ncbi:MAG: hypothetical protein HZB56_07755 [Deltaproteobacteria bacterium]|nr:hypothetical protein [Deltaproteobacteria bacterium]